MRTLVHSTTPLAGPVTVTAHICNAREISHKQQTRKPKILFFFTRSATNSRHYGNSMWVIIWCLLRLFCAT
ncbi:hypothetical protein BJX62DRAFT_196183 [Aspergillus germanicus]